MAAVERVPHSSALLLNEMEQLQAKVKMKVAKGQVRVILWDNIKDNPLKELKMLPIAMILHKSQPYHAILDLSFSLHQQDGRKIPAVNESMEKTSPFWCH